MSDLEGDKPKKILNYCNKKKIGFLAMEYSGHGKSSGKFTHGNISKWTKEVKILIKKIIKKNKFILVGSSMGSWISLNQFKFFHNQILGFFEFEGEKYSIVTIVENGGGGAAAVLAAGTTVIGFATNISKAYL